MYQYQCGQCGYDMTGIESFSNNIDFLGYCGYGSVYPCTGGFFNGNMSNSIRCPHCGKVGHWIKH